MDSHGDSWTGKQIAIVATAIIMMVLSTLSFFLRLLARRLVGAKLWWDDWCALVALFFSFGPNVLALAALRFGFGKHDFQLKDPAKDTEKIMILVFCNEITRQLTLPFVKFSLLLLYHRLFQAAGIRRVSVIIATVVTCWLISSTLVQIFACDPVQFFWDTSIAGGHCTNYNRFWVVSAALNTATDFVVFFLPLPVVWRLEMARKRKTSLTIVFVIGCFACVASIVRMKILQTPGGSDFTWDAVTTSLWTCIEVSTGSISCNIPATTAVFVKIVRHFRSSSTSVKSPRRVQVQGYALSQRHPEWYKKFANLHLRKDHDQVYGLGSLGLEPGNRTDIRGGIRDSEELSTMGQSLVDGVSDPGVISVRHELRIEEIDLKDVHFRQ